MIKQGVNFNKVSIILFLSFILIVPIVFAATLSEAFTPLKEAFNNKRGMESITGKDAVTVSISVGNNAPNISHVTLSGDSFSPLSGGTRIVSVSFEADDPEGSGNLDNSSAKLNVTLISTTGVGTITEQDTTCATEYISAGDRINYTCTINMSYFYDHSTAWTFDAEIKDVNGNVFLNSSNNNGTTGGDAAANWTYTELIAFNLTSSSLTWGSIAPASTNQTDTTSEATENIGNSLSLTIRNTIIDLGGVTSQATYIPAGNFTVGNMTSAANIQCDSKNETESVTSGVLPFTGENNTQIFPVVNTTRRGQGSSTSLYYCLFYVPDDLTSQTYSTTVGGSWDITAVDSNE